MYIYASSVRVPTAALVVNITTVTIVSSWSDLRRAFRRFAEVGSGATLRSVAPGSAIYIEHNPRGTRQSRTTCARAPYWRAVLVSVYRDVTRAVPARRDAGRSVTRLRRRPAARRSQRKGLWTCKDLPPISVIDTAALAFFRDRFYPFRLSQHNNMIIISFFFNFPLH